MNELDKFKEVARTTFGNDHTGGVIDFLSHTGILDPKQVKRWLVRYEYFKGLSTGRPGYDLRIEIAVTYNCSVSFVSKCVYRYTYLIVD